jgi:group I intron endonuclease
MDDTYVIYKHTSPSGKSYIGQTNNYDRRCSQHKSSVDCRALSAAIKKHEWDNFQHEILMEGLSLEEANQWESALILKHNTLAPAGYNLRTGGLNSSPSDETKAKISTTKKGVLKSDETRAKMSEAKKAKLGVPMSDETRAKMSEAKRGIPKSDETKHKMSEAKRGKKRGPHSVETKTKMSATKLGKKHSDETKSKMSTNKKGNPRSADTRAKISEANLGKTHSDETKSKMSTIKLGKKRGPYKKKTPVDPE